MMSKIKDNWLYLFIIIQPILDMISYFQVEKFGGVSYTWILRIILLGILFLICFIKSKRKGRLILYLSPFILFYLLHIFNLYRINDLILMDDTKVFLYTFQTPAIAILLIDYIKERPEQLAKIKKALIDTFLIICISIFIACITNTWHYTYPGDKVGITGWFSVNNVISMILAVLTPWILYDALKHRGTNTYFLICFVVFLTLFPNGTKTCYLALIVSFALMIYNTIVYKPIDSKMLKIFISCLFLILTLGSYHYSSTNLRSVKVQEEVNNNSNVIDSIVESKPPVDPGVEEPPKVLTEREKLLEILNTRPAYQKLLAIHGEDKVIEALDGHITPEQLTNYRFIKIINAKIRYNYSDTFSKLVGSGYSGIQKNSLDPENDLQAIFYFYGYLGFALYLSFYVFIFIKVFVMFIKNYKIIFNAELVTMGCIIMLAIVGGEFSGAFLRKPNSNIFLSMFLVLVYFFESEKVKKSKKKIEEA